VGCGPKGVSKILIGLDRVGIVGLEAACEQAAASGREGREEIVALLLAAIGRANYVPPVSEEDYRKALWREYLRHRGEDIRHLYSEIEVVLGADEAEERERLAAVVTAALAEHELQPLWRHEAPDPSRPAPQVAIAGQPVAAGPLSDAALRRAIKARMDDW